MDQVEVSGKTVEDALKQALNKLGATADEVEFVVLDEGRRGFFGRGARDAVVRVERRAGAGPESKPERQPADTSIKRGGRRENRQRRGRSSGRRGGRAALDRPAPTLTAEDFAPRDSAGEQPEAPPPRNKESRRRQPPAQRDRPAHPEVDPDIEAPEVDYAAQLVDDILRILDLEAEITIREPMTPGDGRGSALAVIDLEGEDLGMLIGRRGDTLQSLQYFVNVVLAHRFPDRGTVTVDAEHYRHRREEHLVSLARRMAERVSRTGEPITLEPMSPAERRLVHMALADDREVETNSIGSGDSRKVVISLRE
ncbi:MAG: RNA-binding cell elongation regulator Jag/EloR [Dehalococcoidia bacterium]